MRVLLLGAGGMLGRDLTSAAPPEVTLNALHRQQLDVTNRRAMAAAMDRLRPDLVLNASGYTAVDRAETDPDAAFATNGDAVAVLGELCARRGTTVVHFSTDYVFDGRSMRPYREEDPVAPQSVYGKSKLAGERGLLASGAKALVVRTQWLFGEHGTSFPRTIWERASRREPTRVVTDQRGRPTSTTDLARVAWQLIQRHVTGLFHAANAGEASWYDVALRIFEHVGVQHLLSRCRTADFDPTAPRAAYSVLDTTNLERPLGWLLPHW